MDPFIKCDYCKKNLTSPLELVCRHTYCSDCLTKEIQNDKVICPVCTTEHSAPASSLKSAKADALATYVIDLNSGAPYSGIGDETSPGVHAECSGCKKSTELRPCYHCDKPLCTECRSKHCEAQKKVVDQSISSLTAKTNELVVLAQALNNSRTGRIQEYKKMKDQISAHVKDLIKKINDEEQELQKKIDGRIQFETDKIAVTEREEKYLQKNKAALDQISDKYRDESNQMVLLKMQKDYLEAAPLWKTKLETHAGRLNAKKEEELHFHPTRYEKNDEIIGTVTDSKNVNIHAPSGAKRMAARNDTTTSKACTIM